MCRNRSWRKSGRLEMSAIPPRSFNRKAPSWRLNDRGIGIRGELISRHFFFESRTT